MRQALPNKYVYIYIYIYIYIYHILVKSLLDGQPLALCGGVCGEVVRRGCATKLCRELCRGLCEPGVDVVRGCAQRLCQGVVPGGCAENVGSTPKLWPQASCCCGGPRLQVVR